MSAYQGLEQQFQLGNTMLQSGELLRDGWLSYVQLGELNAAADNLILIPTYYGGTHSGNLPLIGAHGPLDPNKYCIVIPNLIGNGRSISPSNAPNNQAAGHFPHVSLYDNVKAQKRLLESRFRDAAPALVIGWSMGGMQALQWGCLYPDRVAWGVLPPSAQCRAQGLCPGLCRLGLQSGVFPRGAVSAVGLRWHSGITEVLGRGSPGPGRQ